MSEYVPINDCPLPETHPPVPPVILGLFLHVPLAVFVTNHVADTFIESLKSQLRPGPSFP